VKIFCLLSISEIIHLSLSDKFCKGNCYFLFGLWMCLKFVTMQLRKVQHANVTMLCFDTLFSLTLTFPPHIWCLQTNFYIDSEEGGESAGPALCQMCEEGEEKEASHYCEECDHRLCGTCKRYHDRAPTSRNHHVEEYVAAKSAQSVKMSAYDKRVCQYHPNQVTLFVLL
jgi:hypothetical protein